MMDVATFLAERRSRFDTAIDELTPVVADALAAREDATTEAWIGPIAAAAVDIYLDTYTSEAPSLAPVPNSTRLRFRRQVEQTLSMATMTSLGRERSVQVERLALWLASAAINAATFDALTFADPSSAGVQWLTMDDDAVRDTHEEIDGQRRLYGDTFTVGTAELRYPGEPVGPPSGWLGCRCVLRPVPVAQEATVEQITAAVDEQTAPEYAGGMVALKPANPDSLAVGGGDPASELHVTLAFLGDDVSAMSEGALEAIARGAQMSAKYVPITAQVAGIGRLGDAGATVMFLNGDGLTEARGEVLAEMEQYDRDEFHPQHEPFIAHMTLGYELNPADYEDVIGTEFVLDRVDVHLGGNVTTYQADEAPGVESTGEEELQPVSGNPAGVLPWFGVLAPEGTPSGDRRSFAEGALRWRDLPLPLLWQRSTADGHDGAVIVGQIQEIFRDGNLLKASGVFNATPEADEVVGLMADGTLRGVSVDVDDYEAALDDDNGSLSVSDGRISAATLVPIPAFHEAFVNIGTWADATDGDDSDTDSDDECPEGQHRMPDGTCMDDDAMSGGSLDFAITRQDWNGDASRFSPEEWRESTILHREPEEGQDPLTKSLHSLPILEPNGDLNANAVYAAAARINQVTDHTEEELAAAKRRLRAAYEKLGEDPPEVIQASLAFQIPEGDRGPGWVTNPDDTRRLWRYWTQGPGAAVINWGTPNDFYRCRAALSEYISPAFINETCFTGDTRFITRDGVMNLEEAAGTTQLVLTNDEPTGSGHRSVNAAGAWREAEIKSFGEQEVWTVNLRRGPLRKQIRATAEHGWFVSKSTNADQRSRRVTTSELEEGMLLASLLPMPVAKRRTRTSPFGIAAGAVFGDGTADPNGSTIDLFEGKQEFLLAYFADCAWKPVKRDGYNQTMLHITDMPASWKRRPSLDEGYSFLLGWLAGYIATDGTVDETGAVSLSSARRGDLEHAAAVANRLGIAAHPIVTQSRVGINQTKASDLHKIQFVGATFPDSALLNPEHRRRFNRHEHAYGKTRWVVDSVQRTGDAEEVFCAVVPGTGTFALEDYVWTSNCAQWHYDAIGSWPGQHNGETAVDPAVFMNVGLSASAATSDLPPGEYFTDPNLTAPTAPVVDGRRYYGHLALWDTCHIGMAGGCVVAPHSASDYLYFATGLVQTDDGPVACGQITLGTGHASTSAGHKETLAHYDNTGTAVADVVVGEDEHGIWFSGALRHLTPDTEATLSAAALSGDWRRIRGELELVAALAVNVPGFPVPRTQASVKAGTQESLVAAGVVTPERPVSLDEVRRDVEGIVSAALDRREKVRAVRQKVRSRRVAAARQKIN